MNYIFLLFVLFIIIHLSRKHCWMFIFQDSLKKMMSITYFLYNLHLTLNGCQIPLWNLLKISSQNTQRYFLRCMFNLGAHQMQQHIKRRIRQPIWKRQRLVNRNSKIWLVHGTYNIANNIAKDLSSINIIITPFITPFIFSPFSTHFPSFSNDYLLLHILQPIAL